MDKILVRHPKNWGLEVDRVVKRTRKALEKHNFDFEIELSLIFVGRRKARDLNIKYRKMDYVPQVLGFPNSRTKDPDDMVRLGDILICTSKLKREVGLVENRGRDLYEVLEKWIEHGINNLLK